MQPQVRTVPIEITMAGYSLRHDRGKRFGEEIMTLLGRLWPVIKNNSIPNDGITRVVYEGCDEGCTLFAGVVLGPGAEKVPAAADLERKTVRLTRYAVWKHIGPYHQIPATGAAMTRTLEAAGHRTGWPMVEVYGHWTNDESKLETETFVELR
ncbi:MAG: GyrI-like domain-containing protein [Planctomycetes bacterium]|nr:GyrI-like domain-containing protein [Planctomycetota bacterium]